MESNNRARIHTRRNDSNRRPSGTRRRTALRCPTCSKTWEAEGDLDAQAQAYLIGAHAFQVHETPEAGDQSMDGLHPVET